MINPNEIQEKLRLAGEEWAHADAKASLLEETKKTLKAKLMLKATGSSVAKCEIEAEASEEYETHIKGMVAAREEALIAKVCYDSLKTKAELMRTMESTRRAEMRL